MSWNKTKKFQKKMSRHKNKLKPLEELRFESVGEEFIYLHEKIEELSPEFLEKDTEVKIECLREEYSRIINEEEVDEKYEKTSIYWSGEQERAIVDFVNEKDLKKRDLIFRKKIYKPLKKLIENIIFTYKLFRVDVDIRELQEDCMSFLITKIDRYNPSKGTRAFAFFGTIAKHYLMGEKKASYKNLSNSVSMTEDSTVEFFLIENEEMETQNLESENININVFRDIIKKMENDLDNPKILSNDKKVMEAIIYFFKTHEVIGVYNKNLLSHLIKERTGLESKELTYSFTRLREYYRGFKKDFLKNL